MSRHRARVHPHENDDDLGVETADLTQRSLGKRLRFADGRPLTRIDEADYSLVGDFFTDIGFKEREFVTLETSVRAHPDSVLRESGILKQTGRYGRLGNHEVVYDPKVRRWVYSNRATLHKLSLDGDSLHFRKDTVPSGTIRVVGEIEFHKFAKPAKMTQSGIVSGAGGLRMQRKPSAARRRSMQQQQEEHKLGISHEGYEELIDSGDELAANETTALGEAGDEDNSFMSDLEVAKHIKQYLSRAVPSLVTQSGMAVLHSGVGQISHQLSKGMAMYEAMDPDDDDDNDDDDNDKGDANRKQHPGACVCIVAGNARHFVKQHFTHCLMIYKDDSSDVDPNGTLQSQQSNGMHATNVTPRDIISFINRLVESLSEGLDSASDVFPMSGQSQRNTKTRKPPPRDPVPCCALLIGGDHTLAPMELMQSVTRRDCIVVVEGSKGYADTLCDIINAVYDYNPNAGLDDFQKFLGTADALTEQIIMTYLTGKLIVIKKGTKVEEFQRRLHSCLRGDEALVKAWSKFAQWKLNATEQKRVFRTFNMIILIVSLCATLVTVCMTFTLLMWQLHNKDFPDVWKTRNPKRSETFEYTVYFSLTWATIGFPILLALFQAVYNKVNPSSKLVALRIASEDVLRQIYMYRTRTLEYSAEKCKEHDPNSPGYIKPKDGLVYSTREELLAYMVNKNTDKLSRSPVANVALSPYQGSLPPKDIREFDPGFHDLSPDEYMELRLRNKRRELQALSAVYQLQNNIVNVLIHVCSGVGTCLAAIAANGYGYLHTWIAFTTALVNCLQRYSDFSNLAKMHEQYNKTDNNLSNVEMWFAKLGESKDGMQNRNQLVKKTEEHINEEVETWARLLQSLATRMRTLDDKETERNRDLKAGKEKKEVQKMKEMGFEGLSKENFKKALDNPAGPEAKQLHQSLAKLNDDLGDVVKSVPRECAPQPVGARREQQVPQDSAAKTRAKGDREGRLLAFLPTVPRKFADAASAQGLALSVEELFGKDGRPGLSLGNAQCVSHQKLVSILHGVPVLGKILQGLSQRDFLESVKGIVLHYLVEDVFNRMGLNVKLLDAVPSPSHLEDFLNEMNIILVFTPGMNPSQPEMVLAQVREEEIRDCLTKLRPDQLLLLLQKTQELFSATRDIMCNADKIQTQRGSKEEQVAIMLLLLKNCSVQIAELDVDRVMEDVDERLALWRDLQDLPRSTTDALETMNREELLDILPTRFRSVMQHRSVFQIAASIHVLQAGTPASRVFEALLFRTDDIPELQAAGIFNNPATRERFVMAAEPITQDIINRKNKGDLIRMLRLHSTFTTELSNFVTNLQEVVLKRILSGVQALFADGYAGRIMDRVNDEITLFDVKGLLTLEEREKLVGKLREFRALQPRLAKMDKKQLLGAIGYKSLQVKLSKLSYTQLTDLVFTLTWVLQIRRQRKLWTRLVGVLRLRSPPGYKSPWGPVSDEVIDRMFGYARGMPVTPIEGDSTQLVLDSLEKFKRAETSAGLLSFIGDSLLTSALMNIPPREVIEMFRMIHKTYGDPLVSDVFETVATGIRPSGRSQSHFFSLHFLTGYGVASDNLYGGATTFDEEAFYGHPQRLRETMLSAVLSVCLKEVREIRNMEALALDKCLAASGNVETDAAVNTLLGELHTRDGRRLDAWEVQDIVARLLSELLVSLPIRIFRAACSRITAFDISGIVSQLNVRFLLPVVVYTLLRHSKLDVDSVTDKVSMSKKRLVKEMKDLKSKAGEPVFEPTAMVLREFTEEQLLESMSVFVRLLRGTPGGRFFYQYCDRLMTQCEDDLQEFIGRHYVHLGILILKNKIRTTFGQCKVKQLFKGWDADAFCAMGHDEKYQLLSAYLEVEVLVDRFASMSPEEVKNVVAHLKPLENTSPEDDDSDDFDGGGGVENTLMENEEAEYSDDDGAPLLTSPVSNLGFSHPGEPEWSDDERSRDEEGGA